MQNKYGPVSENPKLISEWDHEKNKHYDPTVITCGSGKRVWWKCKNNHSWNTKIAGRQNGMIGCPYCAGKRVISGKNDLFTVRKDLLSEWDYKKMQMFQWKRFPLIQKRNTGGNVKMVIVGRLLRYHER